MTKKKIKQVGKKKKKNKTAGPGQLGLASNEISRRIW